MMPRLYAALFAALFAALLVPPAAAQTNGAAKTFDEARAAYAKKDYATALRLFRRLAQRGNARAQDELGAMYAGGKGVPEDKVEALQWFQMAENEREALKAYNDADYARAMRIFRPLADRGQTMAEYILGLMYANGQGVPQDYAEALKWHLKAAEQGEAKAQFSVGLMYFKGLGAKQSLADAFKWYRRAADQGDPIAQYNLAAMYARGEVVKRDPVSALVFYTLATMHAVTSAGPAKARLEKTMSPAQIAAADKRVYAWQAKPEP